MTESKLPHLPREESKWRWVIIALIFSGTLINYIDRQTVSVLAPVLCKDLHLSNTQYGAVGSVFLFTYALSMWLWGGVFDRIGNRLGYAAAITLWSIAEIAHTAVNSLSSLSLVRGLLGLGEAGNWPGATRTVAAWFKPRERALGMGLANAGASIGPALAPPLIIALQLAYGWRITFAAAGLLGLIWLIIWLPLYPKETTPAVVTKDQAPVAWPTLFKFPAFWGIVMARFLGDPIWWLYLNWLPKYLSDVRHFSLQQIGAFAWVPFLFAAGGALFGGWFSGFLIDRGLSVNAARKTAIVIATLLLPTGIIGALSDSPYVALAWFSITLFGFQFWVSNVQTLASDFFPLGAVGSIAGFSGTAAGLGAMILTFITGWVVDHFSYTPMLITAGILGPLSTIALFILSGKIRKIEIETSA